MINPLVGRLGEGKLHMGPELNTPRPLHTHNITLGGGPVKKMVTRGGGPLDETQTSTLGRSGPEYIIEKVIQG